MEKNHASLLIELLKLRLNFLRINDVALSDEVYRVDFFDGKTSAGVDYVGICVVDSRKNEYTVSDRQLAGLRLKKGTLTSVWLEDFRSDAGADTLQEWLKEKVTTTPNFDLADLRLKVVAQLKVRNPHASVADTPVYQDFCYEGSVIYKKGVVALTKGKDVSFYRTQEYSLGMMDLRDALHKTSMRPGKVTDENIVRLPIFAII
jgi:hypothetical protein